jgi:hypothetical protein
LRFTLPVGLGCRFSLPVEAGHFHRVHLGYLYLGRVVQRGLCEPSCNVATICRKMVSYHFQEHRIDFSISFPNRFVPAGMFEAQAAQPRGGPERPMYPILGTARVYWLFIGD